MGVPRKISASLVLTALALYSGHGLAQETQGRTAILAAAATSLAATSQGPDKPSEVKVRPRMELDPPTEFMRQRVEGVRKKPFDRDNLYRYLIVLTVMEAMNASKYFLPPFAGYFDNKVDREMWQRNLNDKLPLLQRLEAEYAINSDAVRKISDEMGVKERALEISRQQNAGVTDEKLRAEALRHQIDLEKQIEAHRATIASLNQFIESGKTPAGVLNELQQLETYRDMVRQMILKADKQMATTGTPNPKLREALAHFDSNGWITKFNEFLTSPEGREFLHSDEGKKWRGEYLNLLQKVEGSIGKVQEKFAALKANSLPERNLPSLRTLQRNNPESFALEDKNRVQTPVSRMELRDQVQKMCDDSLSLLRKDVQWLERRTKMSRWPLIHASVATAGFTGIIAFDHWFQGRTGVTVNEARESTTRTDKVEERKKVDLRGQMEFEKKGLNRLAPFFNILTTKLRGNRENIETSLAGYLNREEKLMNLGEQISILGMALNEGNDLSGPTEDAFVNVMEKYVVLEDIIKQQIYTQDKTMSESVLRRNVISIYREAITNLFAGVVDNAKLDRLEKAEFFTKMVNETLTELKSVALAAMPAPLEQRANYDSQGPTNGRGLAVPKNLLAIENNP